MNNIIKCPICHEMTGLRYNENRVYQSRCQNMACRETVTVTAPSGKAAEELFSKFGKGTIHPKLSIPKKIAEELDTILKEYPGWIYEGFHRLASRSLMIWCENNDGFNNCVAYLAGKALGVELVEVEG